jgi:hypothetical protein
MTAKQRFKELKRIITDSPPGRDDHALAQIRQHIAHLHSMVTRADLQLKLDEALDWAEKYFSPRKHAKVPGGADQVRRWFLAECGKVEMLWPHEAK